MDLNSGLLDGKTNECNDRYAEFFVSDSLSYPSSLPDDIDDLITSMNRLEKRDLSCSFRSWSICFVHGIGTI